MGSGQLSQVMKSVSRSVAALLTFYIVNSLLTTYRSGF